VHVVVAETGRLPAPVQDAAVARLSDGEALLIGGLNGAEESVADVVRIDWGPTGPTRVGRVEAMPIARHDACASVVGGGAYLFGGGALSSVAQILHVGSEGGAAPAGELPRPASDVACAAIAGVVYIVGGYTGSEPLRTILAWQPGGGGARVVGLLPRPLRYAAVAARGGEVVIAGGTSGEEVSREVYGFDPKSGSVRRLAQLPYPVTHAAAAVLGGAVLVIGGHRASSGSSGSSGSAGGQTRRILAISPGGGVSLAGVLPRALSDVAAAALGEGVMLAGGRDSAGHVQSAILTMTLKR
jgi:hypothetical protein